MSNLEMYSGLVGVLLPVVVARINAADMSGEQKALVAAVVSILAATGTTWFQGGINPADVTTSFLIIFTAAVVTYQTYWKPSGIAGRIERGHRDIRTDMSH